MIFPEAMETLEQYKKFVDAVPVPVMANLTEFGKTPLFNRSELAEVGVKAMLYPLSAFSRDEPRGRAGLHESS